MDCVDEKLSTLENARTLPSVASPLVPTSHHIHAIGGIYVAAFLSQVQILVTKRNIYRENINLLESLLNAGMDRFDLNYSH